MPRRNYPPAEPPLLEYSFEDCPADKLSSCCEYEYLVSNQRIKDLVERFRSGETDLFAKAVTLLFGPNIFWTLAPGLWPRPYQTLLVERRAVPSSHQPKRHQPGELAELVTPWTYLADAKEVERIVAVYVNPYLPLPQLRKAIAELLLRDYPHLLRKSVKPQLKQAFADLLRRKYKTFVDERPIRKRGRGSPIEKMSDHFGVVSKERLKESPHSKSS
jgi:hypothetical protein